MYFGAPIAPVRQPFVPRPYVRPAYAPPPRVITREVIVRQPPQVINRTVYTPGPTQYVPGPAVTRNYYNTVVRPDYGAIQRAREAQSNWDREHFRLERRGDREAAMRLAFLQQQLLAAQAAQQAQQQPPAMVQNMPQPTPTVSPASPAVDLTPHQDAADGGGGDGGGEAEPSHKPKHLLLFVGLIAVAGVGGYMFVHKKKGKKPSSSD